MDKILAPTSQLYRALWRWHFYAAVLVIPFLIMLSVSGLLMLASKPLETLLHRHLLAVDAQGEALPVTTQLSIIQKRFPHASVKLYLPPASATESARFSLTAGHGENHGGHDTPGTTVYLNPYTGDILGTLDPAETLYARIKTFHGSLFLGDIGDGLIEVAAGFAVLMVLSGLYLGWPREGWRTLFSGRALASREGWRRLHQTLGLLIAVPLLFFLISGLAWTNVWGGKLVQPWNSLPGATFKAPKAERTHDSMVQHGIHSVPWAIEQTPLPLSGTGLTAMNLESVVAMAKEQGFTHFRVHLPQGETSVWTVSATTIAGDLVDPFAERTLHMDQSNGRILADLGFADYPLMGKAMTAFIPLHQGDLGLWNWVLNLLLVAMVIALIAGGVALWWKRRPTKRAKLSPPKAPANFVRVVVVGMLGISLLFPLSAAVFALMLVIDWLLISRVGALRDLVK